MSETSRPAGFGPLARSEWSLGVAAASVVVVLAAGQRLGPSAGATVLVPAFVGLFAVILVATLRVVHHAEALASVLGEPYGTLVLTLAVTSIEVTLIAAAMQHGGQNRTLARDTMFAVAMIVLNGVVGLALLLGALRHHEQQYNLQGAGAYLSVVIPLAVLSLVLPNFTTTTTGPTLSLRQELLLGIASLGLYGVFLAIQTLRHPGYFALPDGEEPLDQPDHLAHRDHGGDGLSTLGRSTLLIAYLALVIVLAEKLATPLDVALDALGAPRAVGGFLVASLVLTSETVSAIRAALADRLQRAVNLALGSVLATIGLTVPAVLTVGLLIGEKVQLGLGGAHIVFLALTLLLSALTFASGRTNVLQGTVHLLLFVIYVFFLFEP